MRGIVHSHALWSRRTASWQGHYISALRICFLGLVLLLLGSSRVLGSEGQSVPALGLPFAIADFNGDLRPDFVSVHTDSNRSSLANYIVEVRYSAGGGQSIPLLGPSGGLRIVARDVNGDKSPDIVVSLAWRKEPYLVLLNDGHGVFSLADPSFFSDTGGGAEKRFDSNSLSVTESLAVPPQRSVGELSGGGYSLHAGLTTGSILPAHCASIISSLQASRPGRAPPKHSRA